MNHNVWTPDLEVSRIPFSAYHGWGDISNFAKSAARALHVLETLYIADAPLRAVEIAQAMALSPSSANKILKTMVDAAYLIFDPASKRYWPAPRVVKLVPRDDDIYFRPGFLDSLMQSVQKIVGGHITVATSQGAYMQLIDVLRTSSEKKQPFAVDRAIGLRVSLFGSCLGAAWLSVQPDEKILAAVRLCRRELGRRAINVPLLIEQARQVAKRGYAYGGFSSNDNKWRGVSIPLPASPKGIVLAIATSAPPAEMDLRHAEIAALLKQTVRQCVIGEASKRDQACSGQPSVQARRAWLR
jgi:DNA-binding IclR family transcriptional regulator